ncbi:MAG TPA: hypothetical protein VGG48_01915 [Rhizomicrobium sp.]|jgi:hypothetical protein
MSSPGIPGDGSVRDDFLAVRSQAAKPNDDWMRALASHEPMGGGAPAAQPGPGPAPSSARPAAAPLPVDQPIGMKLDNWWSGVEQRAHDLVFAKPGAAGSSLSNAAWEGVKGIPAEVWKEFVGGLNDAYKHTLPDFKDGDAQGNLQKLQDSAPIGGIIPKPAFDLLGSAFSPLTGFLTSAIGRPVEEATGVHRELVGNLLSMVAPGAASKLGNLAKLAKGSKAADLAEAADDVPKPDGGGPDGGGPGGGGAPPPEQPAADNAGPKARPFDIAGDEPGAKIDVTPELRARAAAFLAGDRDNPVDVHLDQLADPSTRNAAVQEIAKIIPKDDVKPIDVTRMGAYSLNLTPDEVMENIRPKFASDEMFDAAAMVMNSAAKQFWETARKANASGDPADFEEAAKAYTLFNNYAGAFRDAKTDWGRAGRIQQEAAGTFDAFTKHIQDAIATVGPDNVQDLVHKAAALDDPAKVPPFVSSLRWMGGRDGLLYGWYNWLLSNPATIVKKLSSDVAVATWNVATRQAAATFGSGAVSQGEVGALATGYLGSMQDAIRAAGKALRAGKSQFYGDYQTMDGQSVSRLSRMANGAPDAIPTDSPTLAAVHYLRSAMPTSWIGAADDFAKVAHYRAELHALAYREASARVALREQAAAKGAAVGNAPQLGVSDLYKQLLNNPTPGLHEQAMAAALKNTFQEPLTGLGEALQNTVDKINIKPFGSPVEIPLGRIVMPFVKVPANITKFAYRNSPMPLIAPSDAFRAELSAGGAQRDLAMARVGLGTAASLSAVMMAVGGMLTGRGPSDPQMQRAWRAAGNEPYSLRIGNSWYGYNKIEPLGTVLGATADTVDLLHYAHDEDASAATWSLVLGTGNAMLSKTYMQGFANFLEALQQPDQDGARYADNLMASMAMPQGADALANATNDFARAHYGLVDAIAARTPGWSNTLPAQQDLWGRDIKLHDGFPSPTGLGGMARVLSPISTAPADQAEPIDKWTWENRDAFPRADEGRLGLTKAGQVQSFDSADRKLSAQVKFTPEQLHRFRELAGNGLKDPQTGMGALDTLNSLVKGSYPVAVVQQRWNDSTPAARALMVLTTVNKFRTAAKKQMLNENPDIRDAVSAGLTARKGALAGDAPKIDGATP